jgi:hypothetical protein
MDLFTAIEQAAVAEASGTSGGDGTAAYMAPEGVSDECRSFLQGLLCSDVSKRLSADQALTHAWIVGQPGDRRLFQPLEEADMRPFGSATLALLKSEVALHGDGGGGGSRHVSFALGDAGSDAGGSGPRLRVRRDSTPIPPSSLPPPDGAVDDDGDVRPLFQGWLQKRGRIRRSWQPRYVYIRDGDLYYFKAAPSPEAPLSSMDKAELARLSTGSMRLHPIDDVGRCPKPGKPLRFSVQAAGRVLFLMPVEGLTETATGGPAEEAELVMERWITGFEHLRRGGANPEDEAST